jgi:hypothetical protein
MYSSGLLMQFSFCVLYDTNKGSEPQPGDGGKPKPWIEPKPVGKPKRSREPKPKILPPPKRRKASIVVCNTMSCI